MEGKKRSAEGDGNRRSAEVQLSVLCGACPAELGPQALRVPTQCAPTDTSGKLFVKWEQNHQMGTESSNGNTVRPQRSELQAHNDVFL